MHKTDARTVSFQSSKRKTNVTRLQLLSTLWVIIIAISGLLATHHC